MVLVGVGAWLLLQGQAAARTAQKLAVQYRGFQFGEWSIKYPFRVPIVVFLDVFNPTLNTLAIRAITGTIKLDGRVIGMVQYTQPFELKELGTSRAKVPIELNFTNVIFSVLPTLLAERQSREELNLELLVTIGSTQLPVTQKFPLPALPDNIRAGFKNFAGSLIKNVFGGGKR
ncbi:MAG: hypothetical protein ACK5X3_09955 [Pseudomonadota bacterium]